MIFFVACGIACGDRHEPSAEEMRFPIEKLEGMWQDISRDRAFYEQWMVVGDKHLRGSGYVIDHGDTVFIERLEIVPQGSELIYRVGLSSKRNDELVDFRMTVDRENLVVFENPDHDFPKKITYEMLPDSGVKVYLSGHEAGRFTEMQFSFVRRH